jgi:xanthine dehydrogenase accessory factor
MLSADLSVFSQASLWLTQNHRVILFTVVKTWGSAPRPIGSLLAIREDGQLVGSVSGGCVEDDLIARVKAGEFTQCNTLIYGVTKDQVERVGLVCGGRLQIIAEPLTTVAQIEPAISALEHRELVKKCLNLENGQVTWYNVQTNENLLFDGQMLTVTYGPVWHLLIIGAGQISRYLAEFALALNYQVTICDPREEYAQNWQVAGTQIDSGMPDDTVHHLVKDTRNAVVALTHDPRLDDMALLTALDSPAFYIGVLGSKKSHVKRCERLVSLGVAENTLKRLHAPVGLPIGSQTPPEIALAILAEIVAVQRGIKLVAETM